jgi:hypothetical protein
LEQLRALGVKVALDDFGSGYASLGHLREFPFHQIKIDRTFMADYSLQAYAILDSVTQLGHALGARVTAEGAETEDPLERARYRLRRGPRLPARPADARLGRAQTPPAGQCDQHYPAPLRDADWGLSHDDAACSPEHTERRVPLAVRALPAAFDGDTAKAPQQRLTQATGAQHG